MPLKTQVEVIKELRRMNREIKSMKSYLATLVKLNLEQIKEVKPTPDEKKVLKRPIKKEEVLKWEEIKDEI